MSRSAEYAILTFTLILLWAFVINPLVHITTDMMDHSANLIAKAS